MSEQPLSDTLLDGDHLRQASPEELTVLLQKRVADSVAVSSRLEFQAEAERLLAARCRLLIAELAAINRTPWPQANQYLKELRESVLWIDREAKAPENQDHPSLQLWKDARQNHQNYIDGLERAVANYAASQNTALLRKALLDVFVSRCQAAGHFIQASALEDKDMILDQIDPALKLDLSLAAAWYLRGRTLAEQKRYRLAIHDLNWATRTDPNLFSAWWHLGNACRFANDLDQALTCFERCLKLNPHSSAAYTGRGIVRSLMGDGPSAYADFDRAIELDPLNAQAWNNRGNEHWDRGEYDRALEDYNRALDINPHYVQVLNNRGSLYRYFKEYDRALADFALALKLDPDHAFVYINRGNVYADLKQYPQALEDYTRAIELDPDNFNSYNNRGIVYYDLGRPDEARRDFDRAIAIEPKHSNAYNNRAMVHADLGQVEQAIADYQQAIALRPEESTSQLNLAEIFLVHNRFQEALATLNQAERHLTDEGDRTILFYLRSILLRMLKLDFRENDLCFENSLSRVNYVGWSFEAIDLWLNNTALEDDIRKQIVRLTEQLRDKTKI